MMIQQGQQGQTVPFGYPDPYQNNPWNPQPQEESSASYPSGWTKQDVDRLRTLGKSLWGDESPWDVGKGYNPWQGGEWTRQAPVPTDQGWGLLYEGFGASGMPLWSKYSGLKDVFESYSRGEPALYREAKPGDVVRGIGTVKDVTPEHVVVEGQGGVPVYYARSYFPRTALKAATEAFPQTPAAPQAPTVDQYGNPITYNRPIARLEDLSDAISGQYVYNPESLTAILPALLQPYRGGHAPQDVVEQAIRGILGRTGTPTEYSSWQIDANAPGTGLTSVISDLMRGRQYGSQEAAMNDLYQAIYGRNATPEELRAWTDALHRAGWITAATPTPPAATPRPPDQTTSPPSGGTQEPMPWDAINPNPSPVPWWQDPALAARYYRYSGGYAPSSWSPASTGAEGVPGGEGAPGSPGAPGTGAPGTSAGVGPAGEAAVGDASGPGAVSSDGGGGGGGAGDGGKVLCSYTLRSCGVPISAKSWRVYMDLGPAIVERWGEDGVRALAVYRRVARKITAAIDALPESERKAVHKELYDHLVVPIENGTADLDPAALRRRVGEIWLRLAERFGIEIPELLLNRINRPQLEAAVA